MRILWHSNAPWAPTGYGMQTRLFAPRIAKHHEVAISAFYGLEGDRLNWDGIMVLPGLGGEYGNDYLDRNAERYFDGGPRGGLVWTLLDVWVLNPDMAGTLDMACWVPIDHEPPPPMVTEFFRRSNAIPVAMSKFGRDQLAEFNPLYVPHAVDTSVVKPYDRRTAREQLGAEADAFLVGMVAANKGSPSRKGFAEALQAFARFREQHDDALLFLHTDMGGDENLPAIVESLGLEDHVRVADQYRINLQPHPAELMAQMYSTFDVLLNPAAGEGFGVPVLEAAACGIPSIVTDFSAMPEVAGPGWKVPCGPRWTNQRSWQAVPSVPDITDALEECYALGAEGREALSERVLEHALDYDVELVMERDMLPALAEVERRLAARLPSPVRIPEAVQS